MNPLPDRKKLRREYLLKKGTVCIQTVWYSLVAALAFMLAIGYCLCYLGYCLYSAAPPSIRLVLLPLFVFAVGKSIYTLYDVWKEEYAKSTMGITYVPPVIPSILPDEEILVRGAAQPSAPSETLLRAGVKEEETKAEELLRSTSQGG